MSTVSSVKHPDVRLGPQAPSSQALGLGPEASSSQDTGVWTSVLGWELQVPGQRGSQAARWGCERECARVRVCARVAFRHLEAVPAEQSPECARATHWLGCHTWPED